MNLHPLRDQDLNLARLPIPPPSRMFVGEPGVAAKQL